MANKFSKSIEYQTKNILERQAKERKEENKASTEAASQKPPAATDTIKEVTPEGISQAANIKEAASADTLIMEKPPAKETKKQTASDTSPAMLLQNFIIQDEGRKAKNKTFYLDDDVIKAIKQAAAAKKVTESKLVNDIFKQLLGLS